MLDNNYTLNELRLIEKILINLGAEDTQKLEIIDNNNYDSLVFYSDVLTKTRIQITNKQNN